MSTSGAGPKLNAPGQLFDSAYVTKLAHSLQSLNHPVKIIGLAVVAEIDARRRCGIDRAQGEVASRSHLSSAVPRKNLLGSPWYGPDTRHCRSGAPPSIVTRTRCGAIRSV
jgi:hypothetical protein